jgi:prepilin-type processing-associated H-X9-DG protein
MAMYLRYEEYSKQKCLGIGEALFDTFTPLSNVVHHGFADLNTALLSCYRFKPGADTLYPVTLRSDLPTYLVRGIPNIDPATVAEQSLPETVKRRIGATNILPHGGGYTFPEVTGVANTLMVDGHRYFILNTTNGGKRVLAYPSTLPYVYRGLEGVDRIASRQLGEIVAELHPLFSITT